MTEAVALDQFGRPLRRRDEDDEDEVGRYGMRSDEANDEDESLLRHACASCGETNRVVPPTGFKLARPGEDEDEAAMHRVRYTCGSCGEVNRVKTTLARESQAVRIFRDAYRRDA